MLKDYNDENIKMDLILFSDCCEHICRLCRIIGFPRGNALLMGVGGSGRQSCTKLANFVSGYKLYTIEITKDYKLEKNWRDDVKNCLMQSGSKRIQTTFLVVDTQIIGEKMLEDLNNILNTADVPNIYTPDDVEEMNKNARRDCQEKGKEQTPANLFTEYLNAVKKNIHIVLAMSQMSDSFKSNLRNFPSLISCNTIDYYSEWPEDALISVARVQITNSELDLGSYKEDVIKMFSVIHKSVEQMSIRYHDEFKRYNYVTPTSYLELIKMYRKILERKRQDFSVATDRFKVGLDIIEDSQNKTISLQKDIRDSEPKLQELEMNLTKKNETLGIILEETNKKKEEVMIAGKEQNLKVDIQDKMLEEINQEKADTEREKTKALALADKLDSNGIKEVSSYSVPPVLVCKCLRMIVLLFDQEKDVKDKDEMAQWFAVCKSKLLTNVEKFKADLKYKLKEEKIFERQYKKIEPNYEEDIEKVDYSKVSDACVKLAGWVKAMRSIYLTNVKLAPILQKQAEGTKKLAEGKAFLEKLKKEELDCEEKCKKLKLDAEECLKEKEKTQYLLELNKARLIRAQKLLTGLKEEKTRWNEEVKQLNNDKKYLIGNCVLAAAMMSYGGPFDSIYRKYLMDIWVEKIRQYEFPISKSVSLINVVGNKVKIESWKALYGLPNDDLSIENGIILENSERWPLCIDPQNQASSYIKRQGYEIKADLFRIIKSADDRISQEIESGIKHGKWLLVENMQEKISAEFDSILNPQIRTKNKTKIIKLGDKEIEYNDQFKLFLVTSLPNPHYSPENCVKICLINFAITDSGLKDQMLSLAVSIEKYELEAERNKLIESNAQNELKLVKSENDILSDLKSSNPETILDQDDLINKLYNTKEEANRIKKDQETAREREDKIRIERNKYIELAKKTSLLFFTLNEMVNIDHMYQYSLNWFKDLFSKSADEAEQTSEDESRIINIYQKFLEKLYTQVCRTLFEKDKLLFAFNMTIRIKLYHKEVDPQHFRYLLTGFTEEVNPIPAPNYIDPLIWNRIYKNIYGLSRLKKFDNFKDYFFDNVEKFKKIYINEDPREISFPGTWKETLDQFQKLLVYKAIRPDYITILIKDYIRDNMGTHFVDPPLFKIDEGYASSTKETPIIFIITPGSDPLSDLRKFSEKKMGKDLKQLSLGQGQGKQAVAMFKKFSEDGTWLLYQNTHLYPSWMPTLEKLIEDLKRPDIHPEFRLFLTTASSPHFPISVLQEGIKMTVETSGDVKQMMLNAYGNMYNDEMMDSSKNVDVFKSLLFGVTLFHALLIERKKFGPIGWNCAHSYDFSNEDLNVTSDQLNIMINESEGGALEFKVLIYTASVINYGGRVVDDKDERFIQTFAKRFMNEDMVRKEGDGGTAAVNYYFDERRKYSLPPISNQEEYKEWISKYYENVSPELFGLHPNSDIATNQNLSEKLLLSILSIQPRSTDNKSGKSQSDLFEEKANYIYDRVPNSFDLELMQAKYETNYQESMNTVLTQESARYNTLMRKMKDDIKNFVDAIRGRIVMNEEMESMGNSIMNNDVPTNWTEEGGVGFMSIKTLSAWTIDLKLRVEFLKEWEDNGTPICYWMSGFFFPQAFLTGIKQNYARKYKIPIDIVMFEFYLMNDKLDKKDILEKPSEGSYVNGLYLEGSSYDLNEGKLVPSKPRELFTNLPILWLKPTDNKVVDSKSLYQCPIYKTVARYGVLTTTGHSSNYVLYMDIPTDLSPEKWVMAGVAAFLSLKDD
eukprot:Mrub_00083.p1 GENE.Mrub_00083~~Mrub_00083.p1  ORF type:complete len:1986 (+),score=436.27 Mrub_00083:724-5958(+)